MLLSPVVGVHLEKPEIRRSHRQSHRLFRFLGSRRLLQVRVADDLLCKHGDDVRFLLYSKRFILCGRVYQPFFAKEGSIYLLEINQDFERIPSEADGDILRILMKEFINWHNPPDQNSQQVGVSLGIDLNLMPRSLANKQVVNSLGAGTIQLRAHDYF